MKKRMDITREVAKETGYNVADVTVVISSLINVLDETILSEDCFRLGFIEAGVKKTPPRSGKSPLTGEEYFRDEHLVPYIKIGTGMKRKFKERDNGKK